jgi:hypothetical protein
VAYLELCSALVAGQMVNSVARFVRMQNRLFAALIACLTNAMRGLSVCHLRLQRIDENARRQLIQLVALLICVPCLKASHFCFKVACVLNLLACAI